MKKTRLYKGEYYICKAPEDHCLFCRNCTDVFWDISNGPYAFLCTKQDDLVWGYKEDCPSFADNGVKYDIDFDLS